MIAWKICRILTIFKLQLHILNHIANNDCQFSNLHISDAFSFEDFNYIVKRFIGKTATRRGSTVEDSAAVPTTSVAGKECSCIFEGRERTVKLVREEIRAAFAQIGCAIVSSLGNLYMGARNVFSLQSLETVQTSFQVSNHMVLLCDVGTGIVKSVITHGEADITLEFNMDRNGRIQQDISFFEKLTKRISRSFFSPLKSKSIQRGNGERWRNPFSVCSNSFFISS